MKPPKTIKERQRTFDSVSVSDIVVLTDAIVEDIEVWIKFDINPFGPFKEVEHG